MCNCDNGEKLKSMAETLDRKNAAIIDLQKDNRELRAQFEEARGRMINALNALDAANRRIAELSEGIRALNQQNNQLQDVVTSWQCAHDKLDAKLQDERQKHKSEDQDHWDNRYCLAQKLDEATLKLKAAEKQIADRDMTENTWAANWRHKVEVLTKDNDNLLDTISKLHSELFKTRGDRESWKRMAEATEQGTRKVAEERDQWKDNYQAVVADRNELQKTCAELESFRKLSGEYATLAKRDVIRDENKRLRTENENHLKQIRGLQDTLRENSFRWDVDLATLRKENERLALERKQAHLQNSDLVTEREKWKSDAQYFERLWRGVVEKLKEIIQ